MIAALCHYSLHRRWKAECWTLDRLMAEVKALGLARVDVHAGMLGSPEGAAASIRSALAASGLVLSGLSLSNNFSSDAPAEVRAQLDLVKRWIAVAAAVRAPVSRIFGGHLAPAQRRDPAVLARKLAQITDALGEAAREAERQGVVLALENHGGLPCTGEEQAGVIRAVRSPALKATVDVGNYLACARDALEEVRRAAPYAAYVHVKDFIRSPDPAAPGGVALKACVLGDGTVNPRACLEALRAAGYDGVVALEYEGREDEQTGVPRSLAFLNRVLKEMA